jgi:flagellin
MLAIKNNMMAENAARQLGKSYNALSKSVERLSSGLRINSAKDDAAGLAVRELIRANIAALQQGGRNAQDAISMLQTAEGGLSTTDDILVRMRELAEQSATGSYSSTQVGIMQNEFDQLGAEVSRIANNTDFNGVNLLTADSAQAVTVALGIGVSDSTKVIKVDKHDVTASGLGVGGSTAMAAGRAVSATTDAYLVGTDVTDKITVAFGANSAEFTIGNGTKTLQQVVDGLNASSRSARDGWNVASANYNADTGQYSLKLAGPTSGVLAFTAVASGSGSVSWAAAAGGDSVATGDFVNVAGTAGLTLGTQAAITAVGAAISEKDSFRAHLGYMMNRLEAASSVIDIQSENLSSAESRVSDVDVATEMAKFTRNQVLAQSGISMLSQANGMPQMALTLLRG